MIRRSEGIWKSVQTHGDEHVNALTAERSALWTYWSQHPWNYLTGKDTDGRPIIWTTDERDDVTPVKSFPETKEYLKWMVNELWDTNNRIVFIDKARQMYVSTICCLIIDWYCTFVPDREVVVSRVKEESAIKLINDKIRKVNTRKPEWVRARTAMSITPERVITYGCSGSTVTAVAQNFGVSDSRGITASLIMVDEAAYQEYFPQIYQSVLPMSNRLWAVTTANVGNPGAALFRQLKDEGTGADA
jgi:hypothetical protein